MRVKAKSGDAERLQKKLDRLRREYREYALHVERVNLETEAYIEGIEAKLRLATDAIRWALGEIGDFRPRRDGEGPYYWRTTLRQYAAAVLDKKKG
jgi:hypothetical protein